MSDTIFKYCPGGNADQYSSKDISPRFYIYNILYVCTITFTDLCCNFTWSTLWPQNCACQPNKRFFPSILATYISSSNQSLKFWKCRWSIANIIDMTTFSHQLWNDMIHIICTSDHILSVTNALESKWPNHLRYILMNKIHWNDSNISGQMVRLRLPLVQTKTKSFLGQNLLYCQLNNYSHRQDWSYGSYCLSKQSKWKVRTKSLGGKTLHDSSQ